MNAFSDEIGTFPPPTTEEVLEGYAQSERGDGFVVDMDWAEAESRDAAQRWYDAEIRRAKADALREAARYARDSDKAGADEPAHPADVSRWLESRANDIEETNR